MFVLYKCFSTFFRSKVKFFVIGDKNRMGSVFIYLQKQIYVVRIWYYKNFKHQGRLFSTLRIAYLFSVKLWVKTQPFSVKLEFDWNQTIVWLKSDSEVIIIQFIIWLESNYRLIFRIHDKNTKKQPLPTAGLQTELSYFLNFFQDGLGGVFVAHCLV